MARIVSGQTLINEAYKRADNEDDQSPPDPERHPRTDVLRYVNQGYAELYDLLVEARGRTYYRSATPWTVTTEADTTLYTDDYPEDFYRVISVRVSDGATGQALHPFTPLEEPDLLSGGASHYPTHYELRPNGLAILPEHSAGLTVTVEYIPAIVDVTDDDDSTVDGINGWEEYIVCFAARCMATKDEEWQLAGALDADMARLKERIKKLAPHRDAFRPRRIQDVRGARMMGGRRYY